MSTSIQLLGPPQLHAQTKRPNTSSTTDPFMDLMLANFNRTVPPTRGFTENYSPTFLSTGNPCLDFFYHIVPGTPPQTITNLLEAAWKHNDLMTLKLICHLRGVRDTGKADKEGFYTAALWLHKHHPKTLACNLKWIANFGYFKDLPEILYRLLEGPNVRQIAKNEFLSRQKPRTERLWLSNRRGKRYFNPNLKKSTQKKPKEKRLDLPRDVRLAIEMKKVEIQVKIARDLRKAKVNAKARKVVERYSRDHDFRFLHDQVSQVFADKLVSDIKSLRMTDYEHRHISLAAKWCPSLDSSYDKATLLCESIAKKVFPRDRYPEYEGIEEAHYAYRVRDRLRKEVLVPLREALGLPEIYMSSNRWNSLPYVAVPSVAMRKYKKHFLRHDEIRFKKFLGCGQVPAGALFPHEIIMSLEDGQKDDGLVAELQWKRMVSDLSAKGKLKSCIAVCDVSGSMVGLPMLVCVSLGLLLSEMCEYPWKGKVITFSENPKIHQIEGEDLVSKTQFIRNMEWGYNTDFQKVFDVILQTAIAGGLQKEDMIKKVFVFSDMEFDEAGGRYNHRYNWNTDFEAIQEKFQKNGYSVPEIVFWNLRDSRAIPVAGDQKGVALVSGFSKNLMSLFLEEQDIIAPGPEALMEAALAGYEYKQLAVVD